MGEPRRGVQKVSERGEEGKEGELPVLGFRRAADWARWLERHGARARGVWLRIAKKGSGGTSVTYAEALEEALCYGWIDGQKKRGDEESWLQKFTPRRARSIWSQINRAKVEELIRAGRMKPAGLAAYEQARADGRLEQAYASQSNAEVPEDFRAELDRRPRARAFFATLKSANRYAVLFRIHTAKKPETRARRIAKLVEMLERGEVLHP